MCQLNAFNGCSYAPPSTDYNPAENYMSIPQVCRLSNGAGVLIGITALLVIVTSRNLLGEKPNADRTPLLT
jgi:hypothetical protein